MKKKAVFTLLLLMTLSIHACNKAGENPIEEISTEEENETEEETEVTGNMRLKITVGETVLYAELYDNATTRSLIAKLPLTLPMQDLYNREMVYRFDEALPANEAQRSGYVVGDISYWTPRHSFVIFYRQNGEVISNLQKIGHINEGVEVFETTGNANVKFEVVNN